MQAPIQQGLFPVRKNHNMKGWGKDRIYATGSMVYQKLAYAQFFRTGKYTPVASLHLQSNPICHHNQSGFGIICFFRFLFFRAQKNINKLPLVFKNICAIIKLHLTASRPLVVTTSVVPPNRHCDHGGPVFSWSQHHL
jgi:hypothetical protein